MNEVPLLNSIWLLLLSAIIAAISTFAGTKYWTDKAHRQKGRDTEAEAVVEQNKKIADLELKLALVTSSIVPINAAFQAILIKELTHFHTPEMDELMTKIGPPSALNPEEFSRLTILLRNRELELNGELQDSERDAARMLPMVMKRAIKESEEANLDIQVVKVPPAESI